MKSVFEYLDEMYNDLIWISQLDDLVLKNFLYINTDEAFYFEYDKDHAEDCLNVVIESDVGYLLNLSSWHKIRVLTNRFWVDNWVIGDGELRKNNLSTALCQEVVSLCQKYRNSLETVCCGDDVPALEKSKVDEAIALVKVAGYKVVKVK